MLSKILVVPMLGDIRATLILFLIFCSLVVALPNIETVRAAEDSWTTMEPMPTARSSFGVAVVNGKIYAIGGTNGPEYFDVNEVYDPLTDTWETKKPVPRIVYAFGIAVCNNRIHVIGGSPGASFEPYEAFHEVYDPATDTWESKAAMLTPRKGMDANVVNGKIYVIGGYTTMWTADSINVTEVYDPSTDTWTTETPIPTPPKGAWYQHLDNSYRYASAVLDSKIYVIGKKTQIYDTKTHTWSYGRTLPTNVTSAAAGATTGVYASKRIYVFGGLAHWAPVAPTYVKLTQVYNPETDTWSTGTAMGDTRAGLAVAVIEDELFVIGGRKLYTVFDVNEKYTPIGYIPEFPSWTILPLLAVSTLVMLGIRNKISKKWLK